MERFEPAEATNPPMETPRPRSPSSLGRDLLAGSVVFLVALPLCLGIALASDAPLISGIVAGIVGGLVIGPLSGSHTSVSGPAAGLTAIVIAQIATLGSFDAFLAAVVLAGVMQLGFGILRGGFIAAFFPTSVIKGLLAAIGLILILKQIPHLFGHDIDPEGEMSFVQPDRENTFTELWRTISDLHGGAMLIGLGSLAILMLWDRIALLKNSVVPAPLVVVLFGVVGSLLLRELVGGNWIIEESHRVQVPIFSEEGGVTELLRHPDWSVIGGSPVWIAAVTIAIVASLETLLNLEAVDGLDPLKRDSNPNRELVAQGVGNIASGMIGGLPVTSVIVRSSVNVQMGARTKASAIFHGILLVGCVGLLPAWLNEIPLSALAAILIVTGFKLANPKTVRQMAERGRAQFLPFLVTVLAIVFTDLLVGIIIGLVVAIGFILRSNMRNPLRVFQEKHVSGEVTRVELANQMSFLNRASLHDLMHRVPEGSHVMLDASQTDYIDPDIMDLIVEFREEVAPARGVKLSLKGLKKHYDSLEDHVHFVDFSSREVQSSVTPDAVLQALKDGNERFRTGTQLTRNLNRQITATSAGQFPIAAILSCIDSRTPVEMLFDLGLGDVFSVRMAGNVARDKVLGCLEFSCVVAGAKLILVMGHTKCGAVTAAVNLYDREQTVAEATGCDNLGVLLDAISEAVPAERLEGRERWADAEKSAFADLVAARNVERTIETIRNQSPSLARLEREGKIAVYGAMYDVATGEVEFLPTTAPVSP